MSIARSQAMAEVYKKAQEGVCVRCQNAQSPFLNMCSQLLYFCLRLNKGHGGITGSLVVNRNVFSLSNKMYFIVFVNVP